MRRRFEPRRRGGYRVALPEEERELLAGLADELRSLLSATTDDPSVRRLFPTAYHEDAARDREYQVLVRDELLERRLAAVSVLEATSTAEEADDETLTAWMHVINDLRLVIGTKLDVSEDMEPVDPQDPEAYAYAVYEFLGFLLHELVDALSSGLPEPE